jgi:hypothetical protein
MNDQQPVMALAGLEFYMTILCLLKNSKSYRHKESKMADEPA